MAMIRTARLVAFVLVAGIAQLGVGAAAGQFGNSAASSPSCATRATTQSHFDAPFTITSPENGGPSFVVNVCIDGQGPFPFIVDTGAVQTAIVPSVATQLGLPAAGPKQQISGAGGDVTAIPRTVDHWSMGDIELGQQVVLAQTISGLGGTGPVGLLGADVLSRFGSVRFDVSSSQLIFAGPEGPEPKRDTKLQGPTKIPVPSVLVSGSPKKVSLAVEVGPDNPSAVVWVKMGKARGPFLLDTGTSDTAVTPRFARQAKLKAAAGQESASGAAKTVSIDLVDSGPWSIADVHLPRQTIGSVALPGGIDGVLGADQFVRFTYVVISFHSGELLVGPPH